MSDWWTEKLPARSFEIVTLDASDHLIGGFPVSQWNGPGDLPIESVGRIYTNNGNGTGILYRLPSSRLSVISNKHVFCHAFDSAPLTYMVITFDPTHSYKIDKHTSHGIHPEYRRLKPLLCNSEIFTNQLDPITGYPYAIPNDILAFELENICICNSSLSDLTAQGIQVLENRPLLDVDCILLGYPGSIYPDAYPLKRNADSQEIYQLENSMRKNQLIWTEGKILATGDLLAVTNSSATGMSGSPLLVFDNTDGQWKSCGILAGGPAVLGHYHFLQLASHYHDSSKSQEIFQDFRGLLQNQTPPLYGPNMIDSIEIMRNDPNKPSFIDVLKTLYKRSINCYFEFIKDTSGEEESKNLLNHNLVVPLSPYLEGFNSIIIN